ncbi:MAG: NAD(P)(+) transhydrogenase (Re/Si-specific) subunit beta [Ottowia sp.]|nr:NAD(P)(+) transhydrogenase (Re/Si-specific) subunit beta [Ottowia sp.]
MSPNLVALLYLVAGVLFILALRGLSSPDSSRRGNLLGMIGMTIAVLTTLGSHPPADVIGWVLIIGGIAIGGGIGAVIARKVPMTSMPELVAAFHSLVGMAAVLVTGLARTWWGAKGFGWYWGNGLLHLKLLMLAGMAVLAVGPTGNFRRWLTVLDSGGPLPAGPEVQRERRRLMIAAHIGTLIPLPAVFMARGFG